MRTRSVIRSGSLLGIFAIAATLLAPVSAEARCNKANIKGNYQIHISIRQNKTDFWASCGIRVARNGNVRSSGSCSFNDGSSEPINGGSLSVNRACRVSGTITIGTEDHDIANATMSRNKLHFSGVGELGSFPTTFTAVRL